MTKLFKITVLFFSCLAMPGMGYFASFPNASAADQAGTTAIHKDSSLFVSWADGYTNLVFGAGTTDPDYKVPDNALQKAEGTSGDILCLGREGQISLTFSAGIKNGDGADFAVFENSFSHTFLELGWIEVSSDGLNFVRFPNYSLTAASVGGFGNLDPRKIFGLAGKYKQGFGTPFDLQELQLAYNDAIADNTDFDPAFTHQLTNNFPLLDLDYISHVRVVDINGEGTVAYDARGLQIYDPYPTYGTAGFDLDAIGVINQPALTGVLQTIFFESIPHQKLDFQTLELSASADSGLPVVLSVQSGPATNDGARVYFIGTGTVEVVANQGGDAVYAPAASVLRSFQVADEIQHIFVEPIPNQAPVVGFKTLQAYSSSGLPVLMEVQQGPGTVSVGPTNHVLTLSGDTGDVIIRAFQPGDAATAPAEDVWVSFRILETSEELVSLPNWLSSNSVPDVVFQPWEDVYGRAVFKVEYVFDPMLQAGSRIQKSTDLVFWTNAVPGVLEMSTSNVVLQLSAEETNEYFRIQFEGQ